MKYALPIILLYLLIAFIMWKVFLFAAVEQNKPMANLRCLGWALIWPITLAFMAINSA